MFARDYVRTTNVVTNETTSTDGKELEYKAAEVQSSNKADLSYEKLSESEPTGDDAIKGGVNKGKIAKVEKAPKATEEDTRRAETVMRLSVFDNHGFTKLILRATFKPI
jgi:hypothetical protein